MKAKTLPTALALLALLSAGVQTAHGQHQVVGSIRDAAGQPLPAATVLLLQATDSTLAKGQIGSADGSYSFDQIAPGDYLLRITMLGFVDYFSETFSLTNRSGKTDLGIAVMRENTAQLNEVSVVAKKPLFEQQIDRMVVNVANSITSAGATALEVLQRSPGVVVNRQANSLSMNGKDGVVVMLNGKISRMPISALVQMLDGMSSDNIERIELIHTPPANFDAEGNAGIIHIVLKKNADDGLNGSFATHVGYGLKEKAGASVNFNWHREKINFFGDYSWAYNNNPQLFTNYRSVSKGGNILETDTKSDRDPTRTHTQNARLGLDYRLNEKTIVGVLGGWMDRHWTMDAVNDVTLSENGVPTGFIEIPNHELNHWQHGFGNLNLQHRFSQKQMLNVDVDYARYLNNNPSDYTNRFFDAERNPTQEQMLRVSKNTPIDIWAAKADYTWDLGQNMKWEAGVKAALSKFDNDIRVENLVQGTWTPDSRYTADYALREEIGAAYTAFSMKLGANTDLKAGLRYEYTQSNLGTSEQPNIVDRQYGNFFPSLFVSRKINDNHQVNIAYSRRIQRPDFTQMAPFVIFFDPNTFMTGNTALQPSITDAVSTSYRYKSWQLSLQYSYENGPIAWLPKVNPETNQQLNIPENFDNAHTLSATLSLPFHPTEWWEMQNNLTAQWQRTNATLDGTAVQISQPNWNFNGSQTFRLPRKFTLELSGFYFPKSLFGIISNRPLGTLDIGLQKELPHHRGNLRFSVTDVFFTSNWSATANQPDLNLKWDGLFRFSERVFRLSYARHFGSNKVRAARQRGTGSEEERRRVN